MAQNNVNIYLPASLLRRLGAIFYDLLIVSAIWFFTTIFWLAFGVTFGHPLYPAYILFLYLSVFIYFAWCWIYKTQTVGMKVWKIKLTRTDTRRFGWMAAMARSIVAIFSLLLFGAGFWSALFNPNKLTWHDKFSTSRLIQCK